jgi:hypothetical protein
MYPYEGEIFFTVFPSDDMYNMEKYEAMMGWADG